MNNLVDINKKVLNPAMHQAQVDAKFKEIERRIDSALGTALGAVQKVEGRMRVLEASLGDAFARSEAMVDVIVNKKMVTPEELSESLEKVKVAMEETKEAITNAMYGLEIVERPAEVGDVVRILFGAFYEDGTKIEDNLKLDLVVGNDKSPFAQMREVSKDLLGKKAGDKNNVMVEIPATETENPFAGKKVSFNYEVLKVKAVKNVKGIQS